MVGLVTNINFNFTKFASLNSGPLNLKKNLNLV